MAMYKLTKFNDLYNKLIFQQIQNDDRYVQEINDCDAFFRAYIQPFALQNKILAQKQRYNVFRITGFIEDIFNFLKNFKVDKKFIENSQEFEMLSPMFTFGQIKHYYNNGQSTPIFDRTKSQGNELIDAGNEVLTTRCIDDISQSKIQGRWFNLYDNIETNQNVPDYNVQKRVRKSTPKQLIKVLTKFLKSLDLLDKNIWICIQFTVNCDKLPNNSYDELSKDAPITFGGVGNAVLDAADRMNDPNKMVQPTATKRANVANDQALVGDAKQIIRKTKTINYNTKNKTKSIKK